MKSDVTSLFVTGSMRLLEERWMDGKSTGLATMRTCLLFVTCLFILANVKPPKTTQKVMKGKCELKWNEEEINFVFRGSLDASYTCRFARHDCVPLLELSPFSWRNYGGQEASFHLRKHRKYFACTKNAISPMKWN